MEICMRKKVTLRGVLLITDLPGFQAAPFLSILAKDEVHNYLAQHKDNLNKHT